MNNKDLESAASSPLECTDAVCIECGEIFKSEIPRRAFCSERCQDSNFDWYISMCEMYGEENDSSE